MIKVRGTARGLPASEELTRRGINISATLLTRVLNPGIALVRAGVP